MPDQAEKCLFGLQGCDHGLLCLYFGIICKSYCLCFTVTNDNPGYGRVGQNSAAMGLYIPGQCVRQFNTSAFRNCLPINMYCGNHDIKYRTCTLLGWFDVRSKRPTQQKSLDMRVLKVFHDESPGAEIVITQHPQPVRTLLHDGRHITRRGRRREHIFYKAVLDFDEAVMDFAISPCIFSRILGDTVAGLVHVPEYDNPRAFLHRMPHDLVLRPQVLEAESFQFRHQFTDLRICVNPDMV